jgi:hypothetical protein
MRCCTLRGHRATSCWGNQHRFQLSWLTLALLLWTWSRKMWTSLNNTSWNCSNFMLSWLCQTLMLWSWCFNSRRVLFRLHGASYACYWCQCACGIVGTLACSYGNHRKSSYDTIENNGMNLNCDCTSNKFCYTVRDKTVQIRCTPMPCEYIPVGFPANDQIVVSVSSIQWIPNGITSYRSTRRILHLCCGDHFGILHIITLQWLLICIWLHAQSHLH